MKYEKTQRVFVKGYCHFYGQPLTFPTFPTNVITFNLFITVSKWCICLKLHVPYAIADGRESF